MSSVTKILSQIEAGDASKAVDLLPLVYDELRRLAAVKIAKEKPGQTLQATALVHEAFMRLVNVSNQQSWNSRGHFFSAAAYAMRRILVERARKKSRHKHGGGLNRADQSDFAAPSGDDRLLALDAALSQLTAEDELAGKVVELRRFGGLGHEEIASALGITVYQARQKWTYARAWLREKMEMDGIE